MTYTFILKCALKLVEEIILYYDARSKKHQIKVSSSVRLFVKLLQATITCVMPVHPPAWNNSAPTGRVFVKFYVGEVLLKSDEKI